MSEPLVAIPPYRLPAGRVLGWLGDAYAVPEAYIHAVRRAGLEPVILPGGNPDAARRVLSSVQALLLIGGGDVDPSRYGARPHTEIYGVDPERDQLEIELVTAARSEDLPVLAVCRGAQVVNVALGGSLIQHIPDIPWAMRHRIDVGRSVMHEVKVTPGTRLAEACATEIVSGASSHHQAVDRLGRGLVVSARSDDGLVEGIEAESGWLVAVQWHPEETAAGDPAQHSLFDALARQARLRLTLT
jgi:putative glutamine amidotransferase